MSKCKACSKINHLNDVLHNAKVREDLLAAALKANTERVAEMREALKEARRMYETIKPAGGWQGVYDGIVAAIGK